MTDLRLFQVVILIPLTFYHHVPIQKKESIKEASKKEDGKKEAGKKIAEETEKQKQELKKKLDDEAKSLLKNLFKKK